MVWRKTIGMLVRDVIIVILGVLVLLFLFQDHLIYPGAKATVRWGNLELSRPDGVLHGWVIHPKAPAALVVFGGNAMSLASLASRLGHCSDRAIYLLPYRGYEGQFGHPSEHELVADGVALMQKAQAQHTRVAILGISLGTGVATQVAAQIRPDKLMLVAPYDRLSQVASAHFAGLPMGWLMRDHFDSAAAIAKLQGVPVYILQGDQDEVVSADRTRALVASLPYAPAIWYHVPSTHNNLINQPEFCSELPK